MRLTPKATSRYALITDELARLDAVYADFASRLTYAVRLYAPSQAAKVDHYAAYDTRTNTIYFAPKFLDGPRAKPDAWVIDTIRHEYAHMIVDKVARVTEENSHGPVWQQLATFLGVAEIDHYAD